MSLLIRLQNTNMLSFDKIFGGVHSVHADLIFEQQFLSNKNEAIDAIDFSTDALGYKDLSLARSITVSNSLASEKLISYIGRINYVFRDKFIVNLSNRVDGASKFAKNKRFGTFPSVSLGWRMDRENFVRDLDFFNQLKIRTSYGSTGSQAVRALARQGVLVTGSDVDYPMNNDGNRDIGVAPSSQFPNPGLTWETTHQVSM